MKRKLVAALACRNQGSRLYGKPMQNLDVKKGIRIIDHIIDCLMSISCIDEVVLGISEGVSNNVFIEIAKQKGLKYIIGDETDVLERLIQCAIKVQATDVFRVTSESPFLYFQPVQDLWNLHCEKNNDATFYDEIIDGCGFEIITLDALKISHKKGKKRHRSEMCSLYIRENRDDFKVFKSYVEPHLQRKDLRLTVDNPEDLVICRKIYNNFSTNSPKINVEDIILFLDKNPDLKSLVYQFSIESNKPYAS